MEYYFLLGFKYTKSTDLRCLSEGILSSLIIMFIDFTYSAVSEGLILLVKAKQEH